MFSFNRDLFYPSNKIISSSDIEEIISNLVIKNRCKKKFDISDISTLENLRPKSLLFLNKQNFEININDQIHLITDKREYLDNQLYSNVTLVHDTDKAYNKLINTIYFHNDSLMLKDEFLTINNSFVSKSSIIEKDVFIGNGCSIGMGVKIGKGSIIKNNVSISNAIIGAKVIISENTTIGSTGFGFSLENFGSNNIHPHIGIVHIEDNVRVGANCTIDRGKIDITSIGKNSMLDNQIHIAHNVQIGNNACIAGQCGISGSTKIGNNVIIGGQVGIAGHINIGDNVIIAAKSGVTKNINSNTNVAGFPAIDIKEWKLNIINERRKK
jgi:UDP-3-O-[3-hydroxymyristoyl] glucosamine N-acyltransferase